MEQWKTCETFPKYEIGSEGSVRNKAGGNILRSTTNKANFVMVGLMGDNDKRYTRSVALLVARAYLDKPRNPDYNGLIHLDGDKSNCRADNLMWRPRWYAMKYHKMFDNPPNPLKVYIEDTNETFKTLRELCVKYGLIESYTSDQIYNFERCYHYNYTIHRADRRMG